MQVGRYQLFQADHTTSLGQGHGEARAPAVLRLDTQTGNVDQWYEGVNEDGKAVSTWLKIDD